MLPGANLDYELEALGTDGVAGSGTSPLRGWRPSFPDPGNISGTATTHPGAPVSIASAVE